MKKKIITTAAFVAFAAFAAVAAIFIIGGQNIQKRECELYFLNESESTLVSERRIIKYHSDEDFNETVIEELIKGPESGKNKRAIPRKTKLVSVDASNPSELSVDFNYKFLIGDTSKDVLSAYTVVKTLCGIEGVEKVKVTVERNDIPTAEGRPIGFLSDADINLSTDTNTSETREVTLYFADKETKKLVPEMRSIKVNDQLPLAQYIITEILKGTNEEDSENVIASDTILNGVTITDNICFVNFASNFISRNAGSEEKEKLAVYSIVNSLTELNNIGRVQFLIDGKKVDTFGSIAFDSMLERNTSMIKNN